VTLRSETGVGRKEVRSQVGKRALTLKGAIASHLQERMNTSSALYRMCNELCDVVLAPEEGETDATYYYEFPIEYVKEKFACRRNIIVTC